MVEVEQGDLLGLHLGLAEVVEVMRLAHTLNCRQFTLSEKLHLQDSQEKSCIPASYSSPTLSSVSHQKLMDTELLHLFSCY